jgi:hypothetical protein
MGKGSVNRIVPVALDSRDLAEATHLPVRPLVALAVTVVVTRVLRIEPRSSRLATA